MSIPHKQNGQFIDETAWNQLVDGINANDADVSDVNTKLNKTTQNGGISNISSRLSSIESKDSTQDGRLTAVESKNTSQDSSLSSLTNKLGTGVGTNDSDGSGASGTVGAQLGWLRNNSGGGGGGGLAPGSYRFSVTTTSNFSLEQSKERIVPFNVTPAYATGLSLSQSNSAVKFSNPGLYLISAALQLEGSPNGSRLEVWIADYGDMRNRYVSSGATLPGSYAVAGMTTVAVITQPNTELSMWYYCNSSNATAYFKNNATYFSAFYLGPI